MRPRPQPSDASPLNLNGELFNRFLSSRCMRVNAQQLLIRLESVLLLAVFAEDLGKPRQRPEVFWLQRQDAAQVAQRAPVSILQVIDVSAPVPPFRVVGRELNDGIEQTQGKIVALFVYCLRRARHQHADCDAVGLKPQPLDCFRKSSSARGVGRLGKLCVKFLKLRIPILRRLWPSLRASLLLVPGRGFCERPA